MARTPARLGVGEGGAGVAQLEALMNGIAGDLTKSARVLELSAAEAAAADTDAVHAAIVDDGTEQTITTGITNPPYPRNITATAGGTAGDIAAIQVTITGTNVDDEVITETLPAFTENNAGTVSGSKAFKTVTEITVPAHDGNGATTAIGFGDLIGLDHALAANTVLFANHDGTRESTFPTVATDAANVESNTVDLDTALDGSAVQIAYLGITSADPRTHLASTE